MANTIEELVTQIKDRLDIVDVVSKAAVRFTKRKLPLFRLTPIWVSLNVLAAGQAEMRLLS